MNSKHKEIIDKLPAFLTQYPLCEHRLFFYGSVARDEDRFDSDIDVMCVLNDDCFIEQNRELIREIKTEAMLVFDEKLDLQFYTNSALENEQSIFMRDFHKDKVPLSEISQLRNAWAIKGTSADEGFLSSRML